MRGEQKGTSPAHLMSASSASPSLLWQLCSQDVPKAAPKPPTRVGGSHRFSAMLLLRRSWPGAAANVDGQHSQLRGRVQGLRRWCFSSVARRVCFSMMSGWIVLSQARRLLLRCSMRSGTFHCQGQLPCCWQIRLPCALLARDESWKSSSPVVQRGRPPRLASHLQGTAGPPDWGAVRPAQAT